LISPEESRYRKKELSAVIRAATVAGDGAFPDSPVAEAKVDMSLGDAGSRALP
jgi:hypothetical protein